MIQLMIIIYTDIIDSFTGYGSGLCGELNYTNTTYNETFDINFTQVFNDTFNITTVVTDFNTITIENLTSPASIVIKIDLESEMNKQAIYLFGNH
jgi:hypothetical protein